MSTASEYQKPGFCLNTLQPSPKFGQKPGFFSQRVSETGFLPKYFAAKQKFWSETRFLCPASIRNRVSASILRSQTKILVRNPVSLPSEYQKPGFCLNTSQPNKNFGQKPRFFSQRLLNNSSFHSLKIISNRRDNPTSFSPQSRLQKESSLIVQQSLPPISRHKSRNNQR